MSRKNENRPAQPPSNRVSEAFDEALRLEGDARDSYLAGLAPALRAEVVSLLQALEGAGDFMEAPAANGVFAPQPHGTEFPPAQVGRYVLFEQLGAGGMAQVYRAKTRGPAGFEKQVAIKRIHPYFKSDPNFVEQFEREARLSSCLEHANIVQVYDFLHLDDAYYLVMEYIEGISLEALIERVTRARRRIELPLSVFITNEIAKGLDYAHSRRDGTTGRPLQIVHRDISPKNIMLSFSGSVKLVDFGIAKIRDGAVMTETGTLKGTPYYMAPEQAAGKIVDRRSDIFSAGVVLYEMLAGQRLFRQKGTLAIVEEVRRCAEVPARLQALQAPEPLKLILTKMLAHAPADRYQDAASLHADLQDYLARHFPRFTQTTLAQALGVAFESEIAKRQRLGAEIDRRIELKLRESARRSADTVRRRRRLSVAAAMLLLATFFGSTWTGMLPS